MKKLTPAGLLEQLREDVARLAAVCVLLSAAAVSCASSAPGASPPGVGGQTSVTVQQPSPTAPASPERRTLPPNTYTIPTTPVPKGCQSGLVTITHYVMETVPSAVCINRGAVLRLMLRSSDGNWGVLVTPSSAATVMSAASPAVVQFTISAAGTVPFCLSVGASPLHLTDEVYPPWQLCVTVRR